MDMDLDDEATAAMAAAMGFSSFGAQNPSKRRKYNPRADAAVVAGTGPNTTPLGVRDPNADEIDLADDDDNDDDDVAGAPVVAAGGDPALVNPASRPIVDTSLPLPPRPPPASDTGLAPPPLQVDHLVGSSTLPPRPRDHAPAGSSRGGRGGRGGREQHGTRDRGGKPWWDDYYDPTCNVNPWEHIEKLHGLEPRGEWLSYQESKARWEKLKPHWDESKLQDSNQLEGAEIAAQPAGPATETQSEPQDAGPATL